MFTVGRFKCGYTLNKSKKWVKVFTKAYVIGLYGLTFHKRSKFIMQTMTYCRGHFIRKNNWHQIIKNLEANIKEKLLESIKKDYNENLIDMV